MPHFDHVLKVAHAFAKKLTMFEGCPCICNKIDNVFVFDNFVSFGIPYLRLFNKYVAYYYQDLVNLPGDHEVDCR